MKDVNKAVRTAYYNALNNTITSNGNPVPFFDQTPSGQAYPYIYVAGNTCTEDGTKDYYGFNYTITIVVSNKETANAGGQLTIDDICDALLHRIKGSSPTDQPLSFAPNFLNVVTSLEQSNYLPSMELDSIIRSRTIKIRHRIQQLSNN